MAIHYSPLEPMDSSDDSEGTRVSDENASDRSDTSSDVTELDTTDFPSYFQERNGHLFHSHGSSPYPLPVDAAEQQVRSAPRPPCHLAFTDSLFLQRLNAQHALLRRLLGNNYRGPLRRVLRHGVQRRVLDLCTGTGQWCVFFILSLNVCSYRTTQHQLLRTKRVLDIAREFPHVRIDGLDIGVCAQHR